MILGKVFKVGFTKMKHIPIVFQEDKPCEITGKKWVNALMLHQHLFDSTIMNYQLLEKNHSELFFALTLSSIPTIRSTFSHHIYSKHHIPKIKITDTGKYFIPVKTVSGVHFYNEGYEMFESCHISKNQ